MERPIHEMLCNASRRLSLHMPGGQGKAPFGRIAPYRLDTTELSVTDDLYRPTGAILRAQELAAASAGAAHTLLLHGGSTAGNHAMLLYAAKRGETVILPRNVHISAVHLCAVAGLEPIFVKPEYTRGGRPYCTPEGYEQAISAHPEAKAVLAVRPDYYGIQCDLERIAQKAHQAGMLVLCDEAHGAHFNWALAERNAGACGADLFVQSAHKTLPALTAGAWLHMGASIDEARLRRTLRMVQTSSPSFVNMLSLDDARAWMDRYGAKACRSLTEAVEQFYRQAEGLGYGRGQEDFPPALERDGTRLVLDAPQGGFVLGQQLEALGLDVEMCDERGIVCILSLMDGPKRLKRLLHALRKLGLKKGNEREDKPVLPPPEQPPRAMPLWQAAFAPSHAVPLAQAVERISTGQVGLYPPGVALLTAGERITPEIVEYLEQAPREHLFGLNEDGTLNCAEE